MRPPTIVNQPPINYLIPLDNTPTTDTDHKLARVVSATRQCLKPASEPHKPSEYEPYISSPIDRDDFLEDEPLFATTLSAFGASLTIYPFSSAHLANLNRQDIIADQYGCAAADIASSERTKPLSHGQRFKRSANWDAIEKEREREREAKCLEREAEWQRELATWPLFVPRNPINATHEVVVRDPEWLKQQANGSLFYCPTTCRHSRKYEDCEVCSPAPLDYLAHKVICLHSNLREFKFSTGETIKICPDCTTFDKRRKKVLATTTSTLADRKRQHTKQRWEEKLEAAGLPADPPSNPIVSFYSSVKMDKIEHAQAANNDNGKSDYRASQIRKEVKPNTEAQRNCKGCGQLFVPNHASSTHCSDNCRKQHFKKKQGRPFPHTLTMPRALRNFCPRCSSYTTADHVCQGKKLEETIEMRQQEHNRKIRDANITLSNPNLLTPSKILHNMGGYGKN